MLLEILKGCIYGGLLFVGYNSIETYVRATHNKRVGETIQLLTKNDAIKRPAVQKYIVELSKKFI